MAWPLSPFTVGIRCFKPISLQRDECEGLLTWIKLACPAERLSGFCSLELLAVEQT